MVGEASVRVRVRVLRRQRGLGLPELDPAGGLGAAAIVGLIYGAGGGGEEGDDGVLRGGGQGLVVLRMKRSSWGDDEDIAEADHPHIGDAIIETLPGGGGRAGPPAASTDSASASGSGSSSASPSAGIETEAEIIASTGGG